MLFKVLGGGGGAVINWTRLSYISLKPYYEFFSMRKRRTAVRPVEENSPFSMGKWHGFVHGIDLDNRSMWWKGFCSAGPPVTSFMDRRSRLLLSTPMGAYGLWPFLQPRQGYTKDEEKNTQAQQGTPPYRVPLILRSVASLPGWICLLIRLLI